MTPEAIRTVSQLRHEFYSLFAESMDIPVTLTVGNPSTGNPPIASWIDHRQTLNYVRVYAYSAPDQLLPERPFILRVAVNQGAGIVVAAKWRKLCRSLNQSWRFELSLLPEEILDFLPWIVNLVKSHDQGSTFFVLEPPHAFDFKMSNELPSDEAWTQGAWHANSLVPIS